MVEPVGLPVHPYDPFVPTQNDPFDNRWLGHLLRRTAFGLTAERMDRFAGKSPSEVLDWLFAYDPNDDPMNPLLDQLEGFMSPFTKPDAAQQWWVYRMLRSPRPMQERIALFWHNHFATSLGKIDNPMHMHRQIELFRRLGLANFRDLLVAVGRDPAMLIWLDGQFNRKGKPNENYARELMELFSLGIGNYSEQDVKEVARASTGWSIRADAGKLDPKLFDDGEKEIFGNRGKFGSDEVVDLILARPESAKHISRKMLREFVHPAPGDEVIAHYAQRLIDSKWEIKPVLREMLQSRMFFSAWAYRSKIKGPCELVISADLAMSAMGGKPSVENSLKSMTTMGQPIMYPPSVKGWDGEEAWINANTLLMRYNFGMAMAHQHGKEFTRRNDVRGFLDQRKITTSEQIVAHFSAVLLDGQITSEEREKFIAFLNRDAHGKPAAFVFNAAADTSIRNLIHLMMATPEYQLC